jgi:hypothetical protein
MKLKQRKLSERLRRDLQETIIEETLLLKMGGLDPKLAKMVKGSIKGLKELLAADDRIKIN